MSTTTETKLKISRNNIPFDLTTDSNFPVTSHGVLCFHWSQFCDFSLVHFFGFLDSESDCAAEILHQNFSLFYFRGVHFTSHHWTEGHLAPQLLSNGQGQGSLKRIYYVQKKTVIFTLSEYNQSLIFQTPRNNDLRISSLTYPRYMYYRYPCLRYQSSTLFDVS